MENLKINGISKSELIWVEQTDLSGNVFYVTSKGNDRSEYYLYKMEGNKAVKLGKSKSPKELKEKYIDK